MLTIVPKAADLPGGQFWYVSPADGALMFTNGGEGEEAEIELAGKQVTGKLSTPSSPSRKPHDTHS